MRNPLLTVALGILMAACSPTETLEQKQVKLCTEDVKLGLNDPNSFELVSSRPFDISDGTHRLELKFTAKNASGGRVRDAEICGFKSRTATELNPDDIMNQTRKLARQLRDAGIKVK